MYEIAYIFYRAVVNISYTLYLLIFQSFNQNTFFETLSHFPWRLMNGIGFLKILKMKTILPGLV